MNDQHPAIVIGEPIPEVEPRVDQDRLRAMRLANRILRWMIVLFLAVSFATMILDIGFFGRFIFLVILIAVIAIYGLYSNSWREARRAAKGNRWQTRDGLEDGKWGVPIRVTLEYYGLCFGLMLSLQTLMFVDGGLSMIPAFFGFFAVYAGIGLVYVASKGREPGQISCAVCSYPLVGLSLPCMCSECGDFIHDSSRTSDRPSVRLPWFMPLGILCTVFGLLISFNSLGNSSLIYKAVPSNMLQKLAVHDRKAFDELSGAPMTADKTQAFIDRLIYAHEADDLGYQQGVWLWDQMVAGNFTPDQIERMLAFIPEIQINALESARAGESIEISLRSIDPDPPNSRFRPYYFFGGFEINGDDERHAQSSHYKEWKYLYQDMFRSEFSAENPKNRPFHTLMHTGDEPIEITAHVVVVIGDPRSLVRFDWDEEQKPVFNFQPVWYRVIEIEHTIKVIEVIED